MATIGTKIYTWLHGKKMGEDVFGNRYYCSKKHSEGRHVGLPGKNRRWVLYSGNKNDPSRVPACWHSWLHYLTDDAPDEAEQAPSYAWEMPHQQNLTGTPFAYVPDGHITSEAQRAEALGDYQAWKPGK